MTDVRELIMLAPGVRAEILHGSLEGPVLVARITMEPGASGLWETHHEHNEHLVAISGKPTLYLGAAGVTWSGLCVAPSGVEHVVRNESRTETAELIAIMQRIAPTSEDNRGAR